MNFDWEGQFGKDQTRNIDTINVTFVQKESNKLNWKYITKLKDKKKLIMRYCIVLVKHLSIIEQ